MPKPLCDKDLGIPQPVKNLIFDGKRLRGSSVLAQCRHSEASRKLSLQFCANGKLLRNIENLFFQKDWVEVFVLQSFKL